MWSWLSVRKGGGRSGRWREKRGSRKRRDEFGIRGGKAGDRENGALKKGEGGHSGTVPAVAGVMEARGWCLGRREEGH